MAFTAVKSRGKSTLKECIVNILDDCEQVSDDLVKKLESKLFNISLHQHKQNGDSFHEIYGQMIDNACELLGKKCVYTDKTFAQSIVDDDITLRELISSDKFKKYRSVHNLSHDMVHAFAQYVTKEIAQAIEQSCLHYTIQEYGSLDWTSIQFTEIYTLKCSILIQHLDEDSLINQEYNPQTKQKLISGEIDPEKVAFLTESQLCPDALNGEREKITRKLEQKIFQKVQTTFICTKCKHNKTVYESKQIRAADEGATLFITCLNCNYRWKDSS